MLSIVIPCYNEQDNLEKLFSKLILLTQTYSEEDIERIKYYDGNE